MLNSNLRSRVLLYGLFLSVAVFYVLLDLLQQRVGTQSRKIDFLEKQFTSQTAAIENKLLNHDTRISLTDSNIRDLDSRIYTDFTEAKNLVLVASKSDVEKEEVIDAIQISSQRSKYPVVIINNSDVRYVHVNKFFESAGILDQENAQELLQKSVDKLSAEQGVILIAAPAILTRSSPELDFTDSLINAYNTLDN